MYWSHLANDPQPVLDRSDGGSIWPAVGDSLVSILQVPIGFANVAVGGTSSTQWSPDGLLHPRLVQAGKELGAFRAVFWQQGESDVIEKATSEAYMQRLLKIRESAETEWGTKRKPWFLAKSTLHPTVYNDPLSEHRIRSAIDELIERHEFDREPDTDMLANENRGPVGSRRHFNALGQRNAAAMWFATLLNFLQQPTAPHVAAIEALADMHLLEPAWSSRIVHRESSIMMQLEKDGPIVARLAYPASEILSIEKAQRNQTIKIGISGDSISTGLDASGTTQAPPNQPGYPDLVAAQLMKKYGCDVLLDNRAVSGWSIENGVTDLDVGSRVGRALFADDRIVINK